MIINWLASKEHHTTYQGWTNYETWAVNQRFGEVFAYMGNECEVKSAELREMVRETFILSKITPLERDFLIKSMERVDWDKLAETYAKEDYLAEEY